MSHVQLDPLAAAQSKHFSEQLSDIAANPSSSALLYLLPPCLILLAIDVVVRLSHRQIEAPYVVESPKRNEDIKGLGARAHQVLANFKELDRRLSTEGARSKHLYRMLQKQRNFAHHQRRLAAYTSQHDAIASPPADHMAEPTKPQNPESAGAPFTSFCERLLLQNQIWKQQKQIKALQSSLDSMKTASSSNAFQAFCDRLILSNNIWKLQKEVDQLMGETERLKKSRIAAVTRAAKQMVQDVRKERLMEEFVKDLIAEVAECRQAIVVLRAEHEKEIQELADEWRKDCRRLSKEVDRLKLAQEARMVEQDLSNHVESDLIERLSLIERNTDSLSQRIGQEATNDRRASLDDDTSTLDGSDLEHMSNMSTTTYVGSAGDRSPNQKISFEESSAGKTSGYKQRGAHLSPLKMVRRQSSSLSLGTSPVEKSPVRRLDPGPYAGFSFNPLFFGNADMARKEETTETESPIHSVTFALRSPPSHRKTVSLSPRTVAKVKAEQGSQPKRVQWKV